MTLLSLQVGDHEGYTDLDSQRRSERNYKFSFDDKALDENPVPKPDPEPVPEAEAGTSGRSFEPIFESGEEQGHPEKDEL